MRLKDSDLTKLRRAFANLAEEAPAGSEKPDAELIWQAANGELPPDQTSELIDRAARCPETAEIWRLALAIKENVAETADNVVPLKRPRSLTRKVGLAVAAVVVAGVGLSILIPLFGPKDIALRSSQHQEINNLCATEVLNRDSFVLSWSEVPSSVYELRVTGSRLQTVYHVEYLEETTHHVPEQALQDVVAGERVLWRIVATDQNDVQTSSPTFVQYLETKLSQ